jgi:SAM-dependent methyltransferase
MTTDWYRNFFHGITVDMWREAAYGLEWTKGEVDFALRELNLAPGAHVLDIPCGHGRHAIELARRGYRVTGVDISADALRYAKADAEAAGVSVEWRQLEMQDFDESARYDGAIHFGNSFGYIPHADSCRFLDRVARALKPGARLALDCGAMAEAILPVLLQKYQKFGGTHGNIDVQIENAYDAWDSRLDTTFRFTRDGQTETRMSHQHVYTIAELRRMLAAAGLTTVAIYGDTSGKAFALEDNLRLVAQRE